MSWDRIIPADAGSTRPGSSISSPGRGHPRGCGEHHVSPLGPLRLAGSSPRMRGALLEQGIALEVDGIIPADAGSTPCPGCAPARLRDHPRGCGEHFIPLYTVLTGRGSSPRMRGARRPEYRVSMDWGIIPADAGSTAGWLYRGRPHRDHPRGCGEHKSTSHWNACMMGSSPRMRGARAGS